GVNAQATTIAGQTAAQTANAFATSYPYSVEMPGQCGSDLPGGSWMTGAGQAVQVTCEKDVQATALTSVASYTNPAVLQLRVTHPYASAYTLDVDTAFLDMGTCSGLVSSGQLSR